MSRNEKMFGAKKAEHKKVIENNTHIIDGTYWIIVKNDGTIFLADGPWLDLLPGKMVVWLGCSRHISNMIDTFIQYLFSPPKKKMISKTETTTKKIEKKEKIHTHKKKTNKQRKKEKKKHHIK